MDEDPDFDYEMEPQAAYGAFQTSVEEAMDELSSEGAPMSDVGVRLELLDKAGIDVDFYDPTASQKPGAQQPITTSLSTQVEGKGIAATFEAPLDGKIAQDLDGAGVTNEVASKAASVGQQIPFEESHESASHLDSAQHSEAQTSEGRTLFGNAGAPDERNPGEDASAIQAVFATTLEESDQLQEDGEENAQPNGEEGEHAQGVNGHTYYTSEEDQNAAVRVTFHGQDFVIWSATDIPTFLAVAHNDDSSDPDEELEDVVQFEAPALDVAKDVLWQPLDSLFAGLRDKKALGEFLDESHELHIAFPDLDLDVAEDNLYCREITLDDLWQLHHGLGIAQSLHIQVSERPRFITKYNELAQHVAGILSNQLEHSSDDEEEAANSVHALRNTQGPVEAGYEPDALQSSAEVAATEELNVETARAPQTQAAATGQITEAESEPDDANTASSAEQADQRSVANAKTNSAQDDPHMDRVSEQHEVQTYAQDTLAEWAEEEEGVDQLTGELPGEKDEGEKQEEVEEEEVEVGRIEELGAQATAPESDHVATVAEEGEDVDETGHGEYEQYEGQADAEAALAHEEEGDEEEEEEGEGEGQEDEAEYREEEDEDAEYADELGESGEEVDQTFHTTINDSSEAEEDELEAPEEDAAHSSALVQSAEHSESTYAYDPADDEQDWQGEGEEQIVEYIEEQADGINDAGSASSTLSTSFTAVAQRKRGLDNDDEDDGDAAYEQDDYEAESKRVKVD